MDLQTTNTWLAVIAVVSVLQFAGLCVLAALAVSRLRRVENAIDSITEEVRPVVRRVVVAIDEDIRPLAARASTTLEEVSDAVNRLRHAQMTIGEMVDRTSIWATRLKAVATSRVWPALGIVRGIKAAAEALRDRRPIAARERELDRMAEARFAGEGGGRS